MVLSAIKHLWEWEIRAILCGKSPNTNFLENKSTE